MHASWRAGLVGMVVMVGVGVGGCDPSDLTGDGNTPPVADAGTDRAAYVGETVSLDPWGSSDADGDALAYTWTLVSQPDTSGAVLEASGDGVRLVPDVPGSYRVTLAVSDGEAEVTDEVVVTASWDLRLEGVLSSDTTLVDRGEPYVVSSGVRFEGAVVIEPGVTVELGSGAHVIVGTGGSLSAVGTETDTIRFVGTESSPGWHEGIHFRTTSSANELTYVEVSGGGSGGYGNVTIWYDGSASVTHTLLRSSSGPGLELDDGGRLGTFSANRFQGNGLPVRLPAGALVDLDGATVYADGNQDDRVEVAGGTTARAGEWPAVDGGYYVTGSVGVESAIVVAPGARFEFAESLDLTVDDPGTFTALGTETDTIRFVGADATPGFWNGVHFRTVSNSNRLDWVEVAHGGGVYANVSIWYDGRAGITNSLIRDGDNAGLSVDDTGQLSAFESNTFRGNEVPVFLTANHLSALDAATVYADGNTDDRVRVEGGTTAAAGSWPAVDGGYYVTASIDVESAITVEPGARFEFAQAIDLWVGTGGTFTADAAGAAPIVFTGAQEVAGFWGSIHFRTVSTANVLRNVEVAFAGAIYGNVVVWYDGSASVLDSQIHDSASYGIWKDNTGSLVESGNTFSSNASGDVYLEP